MAKPNEIEVQNINVLGSGTVIKGEIKSNGDLRIDGTLIGSITTKGKIIVGTTGTIDGEVTCQNADFSGVIKAKILVSELLQLKATAKFNGEVITNKLSIEPGAKFSGSCNMTDPSNSNKDFKMPEKNEPVKQKE